MLSLNKTKESYVYIFQTLKDESVSFISSDERAVTYTTEKYNDAIDAWMQAMVPSFDISRRLNWDEYVRITAGMSAEYMKRIYGQKKYNRELFVDRMRLSSTYEDFISFDKILFPLLGEAGQDKTNQLCYWTEKLQEQGEAVMIFSGADFSDIALGSKIKGLFTSSRKKTVETVLEQFSKTACKFGRNVYIFFDAINECVAYPDIQPGQSAPLIMKASDAQDMMSILERVPKAYYTGDSLSYFALERILVICAVSDWELVSPIMKNLREGNYSDSAWFDKAVRIVLKHLLKLNIK